MNVFVSLLAFLPVLSPDIEMDEVHRRMEKITQEVEKPSLERKVRWLDWLNPGEDGRVRCLIWRGAFNRRWLVQLQRGTDEQKQPDGKTLASPRGDSLTLGGHALG